jgi:hypothetical protein
LARRIFLLSRLLLLARGTNHFTDAILWVDVGQNHRKDSSRELVRSLGFPNRRQRLDSGACSPWLSSLGYLTFTTLSLLSAQLHTVTVHARTWMTAFVHLAAELLFLHD